MQFMFSRCDTCRHVVPRTELVFNPVLNRKTPVDHRCGAKVCKHCGRYLETAHECYVQRYVERDPVKPKINKVVAEAEFLGDEEKVEELDAKEPGPDSNQVVFFDCEADCRAIHKPYLIRIHDGLQNRVRDDRLTEDALGGFDSAGDFVGEREGDYDNQGKQVKLFFEGRRCFDKFIEWMLQRRVETKSGFTVIAHNGSGYDWLLLYPRLVTYTDTNGKRIKDIRPLYRGSTLLAINVGRGARTIRFIDSLLFAMGTLASYPTTFGIVEQLQAAGFGGNKEHFPHWLFEVGDGKFLKYRGPMPPKEAYHPDKMTAARRTDFDRWYETEEKLYEPHTDRKWNFMQQAKDYCDQDVQVLRRAMRVFRNEFLALGKVDPLTFVTLPSACLAAYRKSFMPLDHIANLTPVINRILRQAVMGGRTETRQFYWAKGMYDFKSSEQAKYVDVNSLYPSVMVKYPFPKGHPRYFGG